jgi:AcrR family transcriptional regulator
MPSGSGADLAAPPPPVAASTPRRDEILDVAERLVETEGADALTMRRLAEEVGMRAPSLYKHVADKAELEAALQERALLAIGHELRATRSLRGLADAYRRWALAHPGLYGLTTRRPLARARLTPGLEDWAALPVVVAAGGDEHRARVLWAAAHGLVDLELNDRFPPGADLDAAWRLLVRALRP